MKCWEYTLNGKIWWKTRWVAKLSGSEQIMVENTKAIYSLMSEMSIALTDTSQPEIHHNKWGGKTHEPDIDREISMYVV